MDPKANTTSPGQLDPKLQEAYDKVMAVPTEPAVPPTATPEPTMPTTSPSPDPSAPTAPVTPQPTMPAAEPAPAPVMPTPAMDTTPVMPTSPDAAPTTVTLDNPVMNTHPAKVKKPMKVSPVVLIVGGLVLLVAYALIWIKIFNLQVPFINQ